MTHDYKAAFDTFIRHPSTSTRQELSSMQEAVIHALRIADRLMGDWNEEMYVAFMNEFNPYQPMTESFDAGIKAMRYQMLKELDLNDQT